MVVLLVATGPLRYLPDAALAAVVFLIGAQLVDMRGMHRLRIARRHEFAVALITAAAVVGLNVQYGIGVAIAASIIDHLRHSYRPRSHLLVKSAAGHWTAAPVEPGGRTEPGLVVYRFGTSLYFANASQFGEDLLTLTRHGGPLRWLVLDGAAIGDVDYTASAVLSQSHPGAAPGAYQGHHDQPGGPGAGAAAALRDQRRATGRTGSTTPRARRWPRSTPRRGDPRRRR